MLKKLLSLSLAALLLLSVTACGSDDGNDSSGSGSGKDDGTISSGGITDIDVDSDVIEASVLANKNYDGKEFTFYYWYQVNEIIARKVNAFNEKHNAKVKTTIGTSFMEDIAKANAGGKPYDIIANAARFAPQSIFANLFEPLNDYIKDVDYFDNNAPKNGGILKTVNDAFTWKDKIYAVGSAKSCYSYAYYYNKKKYAEAGLEDPYELWKAGEWTWDKVLEQGRQVTDVANTVTFLETIEVHPWLAINGLSYIKRDGDTYSENFGDPAVVKSVQEYVDLIYGSDPIMVWGSQEHSWYSYIKVNDGYTQLAGFAKLSSHFGRKASNLGVVPLPSGLIASGAYPTHEAQGYSAGKGAKDPSVAACYALFESRIIDSDVGSDLQMPAEIRNAIDEAFSKNGFCPTVGFADASGELVEDIVNWYLGRDHLIVGREDVVSTLNNYRNEITGIINATMAQAKNLD